MFALEKLQLGMILDNKYQIVKEIARGGMGIVYEAYDIQAHRQVAIKIVLANQNNDEIYLKRFQKEVEAYSRLSHPNVVKVYDAGIYDNSPYIIMEYIEGMNICQYVNQQNQAKELENEKRKNEKDWKLCARLIYETALGLEYIHKQKMFHRDIKPTNILVRSNGSPVIIDLGLVKFNQERSYNLTRSRDIIGTCQYMPIEQTQGKRGEIDARSDVYSLGLVLYELLTGKRAYSGKNITDIFSKIVSYYPPLPSEINPEVPSVLEEITIHATEKQKEKRYPSAQEFANALKQYLDDSNATPTSQYSYYKKRLWIQKNKNKIFACCFLLLLLVIAGITFNPIKKDRLTTENEETKKIEKQKLEEECNLGKTYFSNKEYDKAVYLLEKTANQGLADAQCFLGFMYTNGHGVKQDIKKAVYWYEKAVEQNFSNAQFNLGCIYYQAQNYQKAFSLWEKAAIQGEKHAQHNIGCMYESGQGVKQDLEKAIYWIKKAESQGFEPALQKLHDLKEKIKNQGSNPIQKNLKELEKTYAVAYQYYQDKKFDIALKLFQDLAQQGHDKAQYALGSMYYKGQGVKQDYGNALYLFEKAADQGNTDAIFKLGTMYHSGEGVIQNVTKALYWFEKAANQGDSYAQHNVGVMYEEGVGVKQDLVKARYWFEKAANQGNEYSQNNLGSMYYHGKGVEQDLIKARYWFEKAANQGNDMAQKNLDIINKILGKNKD